MEHKTTTEKYQDGVKAVCTCGWIDRWPGPADGSAQESAAAHARRYAEATS